MLYETLHFSPGGDRAVEVELGDGMSFTLNFTVHRLVAAIREAQIPAIEDIIPELASLQINYDPDRISYESLIREIAAIYERIGSEVSGSLPSRLLTLPIHYYDEETTACIEDYRKTYPEKQIDPDLLCELNGVEDRAALARRHSGTEYWVAALGFWPGLCSLLPLRPGSRITAPKYNPPRTWTPKGAVGIGGALCCIYPDRTPGGYQLIGRCPAPIYDGSQRLPAFRDSLALLRAGERVRFRPVSAEECAWIDAEVAAERYEHDVVEYQVFSVDQYLEWAKAQGEKA
ncbi:allophanate hydrolase subunit 1 [Ochrobactrum sp. BTU2]|uniref:5-oxoprolinase subunit B family protein n=1 Tax=Ochrobactrum sp. BTU2 TaxID=2856166 RepID=UPI00211A2F14|nr:allophanate hydrolase subunit 1 [Ochrobactrum sp. BTU2]MCQ9148191.1 allophanate hydrolase subunit 1 [Ochrobactrum sp. BTU2]